MIDVTTIAAKCRTLAKQNVELKLTVQRLKRLAFVDGLTGLSNRRYLEVALDCEIRRAARSGEPLTFMMCDVDHFKRYNDRFGHLYGDAVLCKLADTLTTHCRRAGDIAARYGGEEFALLLPGIDAAETICIAERLRQSVAKLSVRHASLETPEHITISVGVTTFKSAEPCTAADVIRAADLALYRAKHAGRNRTKYHATKATRGAARHEMQGTLNLAS